MFKKIKKKSYLPLISFFSLITPSMIAIACESQSSITFGNNNSENNNFYSKRYYRPFQFNEIKKFGKGQPIMGRGLGFDAYSHGLSFIWNVMRKLEFKIFQGTAKVIDNGKTLGIKYHDKSNKNEKKNKWEFERKYNQSDFENDQEADLYQANPEKILKIFEKLKVETKWNTKLLGSGQYWFGEPLGVDGAVGYYTIKRSGYHSWKIYWTATGEESNNTKRIFNVDDFTKYGDKNKRKKISDNFKQILKGQKILVYAMPNYFSIIEGIKEKPEEAKIEEGNSVILVTQVRNYDDSIKDYKLMLTGGLKLRKKIKRSRKWSFNYAFISHKNFLQGFQIIKNQVKIEEMKMLITAAIKNIHHFLNKNNDKIFSSLFHPKLKKMFDFIRKLKINKEEILKRIHQAIEELNNGSHNMFAVEIFARGVENVPLRYMPGGIDGSGLIRLPKLAKNNKLGTLTGISNTLDIMNIIGWASTTKKGYADENGNKSQTDWEGFDPDKGSYYIRSWDDKTKNIKRLGREISPMGGIVEREKYQEWAIKYNNWIQATSENPENEITKPIFDSYWNKNKKYLF